MTLLRYRQFTRRLTAMTTQAKATHGDRRSPVSRYVSYRVYRDMEMANLSVHISKRAQGIYVAYRQRSDNLDVQNPATR